MSLCVLVQILSRARWSCTSHLWPHQYCLWNWASHPNPCSQSIPARHESFDLYSWPAASVLSPSAAASLWWTALLCFYSKVSKADPYSPLKESKQELRGHHASDFQLWGRFQAGNVHIIARNPPIWSCCRTINSHRITLKYVKTALNPTPPPSRK